MTDPRLSTITPDLMRRYVWRYRRAALAYKQTHGKRADYRRKWVQAAWSMRQYLRATGQPCIGHNELKRK